MRVEKLVRGVPKFQRQALTKDKELFDELATGQSREVPLISCADSRIAHQLITQTAPGDLFVCRNTSNIVPLHAHAANGMTASVEDAVAVKLKVGEISLPVWVYDIGSEDVCCSHLDKRDYHSIADHCGVA